MLTGRHLDLPVLTIGGSGSVDLSIEAMGLGAIDDFLFPFELKSLVASIRKTLVEIAVKPEQAKERNK